MKTKKLGFIGLGRMGKNMVMNLLEHGHYVVAHNRSAPSIQEVAAKGALPAYTIEELVEQLDHQKIIWLMIPAGRPVDLMLERLLPHLNQGDLIIDGGNSFYQDSLRRYKMLKRRGIRFLDCGTSGGQDGARSGACMMIGGEPDAFKEAEVFFRDMCVADGYGFMGKAGSGHFVKMVHNGIEYGMMGAIAEGMAAIREQRIDATEVARVYAHGSIIESKLMSWLRSGMEDPGFKSISGEVPKGETEAEMKMLEQLAKMPILHQARLMRVRTRKQPSYAGKLIAAMRNQFGGHAVKKK